MTVKPSLVVLLSIVFANVATSIGAVPQDADRPNIIVFLVDDLRWDGLAVTGHPFVETPNIDQLAREGALFTNAFVTTPLCSPARASFLTGRYARAHGIRLNTDAAAINFRMTTFPALLEDTGYDTAFIGKWHMGEDSSPRPGFTHWISFSGQGHYTDPELNINGRLEQESGHLTDVLVRYADDFVRTASHGSRPFLLYLSHKAVHEPGDPPRRHRGAYANERVPCSPGCRDTLAGKPALTRDVPGTAAPRPGGGPPDANIQGRHRRLLAIDDGVWRLRRTLEEEGILDQTIIVFTSDNGYFHREHGIGDKRWAYEEALRIPMIVRYPPRIHRSEIAQIVLNIDLAPTLLELAGAPLPEEMHGRSMLPLFENESSDWRNEFVAEYFAELGSRVPDWEALRTEGWKFIRYPDLGPAFDELYDLDIDSYELTNLALEPSTGDVRESLTQRLDAGLAAITP